MRTWCQSNNIPSFPRRRRRLRFAAVNVLIRLLLASRRFSHIAYIHVYTSKREEKIHVYTHRHTHMDVIFGRLTCQRLKGLQQAVAADPREETRSWPLCRHSRRRRRRHRCDVRPFAPESETCSFRQKHNRVLSAKVRLFAALYPKRCDLQSEKPSAAVEARLLTHAWFPFDSVPPPAVLPAQQTPCCSK